MVPGSDIQVVLKDFSCDFTLAFILEMQIMDDSKQQKNVTSQKVKIWGDSEKLDNSEPTFHNNSSPVCS